MIRKLLWVLVHGIGPNQVGDIRRNDLEKLGAFGSITLFLGVKRPILGSLAYISLVSLFWILVCRIFANT